MICFKFNLLISRDYNLQASLLGISLCELRSKAADLMFLNDLSNESIDLLFMTGFNVGYHCLSKNNLFHVPLCYNNYSFDSFFPRVLSLANHISIHLYIGMWTFFYCPVNVFKQNVFLASINNNNLFL